MVNLLRRIEHWFNVNFNGWHCYKCKHRLGENYFDVLCASKGNCCWEHFELNKKDKWEAKP